MEYLEIEKSDRIGTIVMARPEKRNALHPDMITELYNALGSFEDDPEVKVVVLQGMGNTFSAGADLEYLKKLQDFSFDENLDDSSRLKDLFQKIYSLRKPVVAQIEGHAIAGGCGLVTVCDFAFAVPEAKFGYTEVKIGFVPALVLVFLLRKIGEGKARDLLLTGKLVDAAEAKEYGLINAVVPSEDISDAVRSFARGMIENCSTSSLGITKGMISTVQDMKLDDALEYAARINAEARETEDCKKGMRSFLDKSKICW